MFTYEALTLQNEMKTAFHVWNGKNRSDSKFQVRYQIHFKSIMRGYHVYQPAWSSVVGEKFFAKHDSLSEALHFQYTELKLKHHKKIYLMKISFVFLG